MQTEQIASPVPLPQLVVLSILAATCIAFPATLARSREQGWSPLEETGNDAGVVIFGTGGHLGTRRRRWRGQETTSTKQETTSTKEEGRDDFFRTSPR
jgi:hypothetical protein